MLAALTAFGITSVARLITGAAPCGWAVHRSRCNACTTPTTAATGTSC